MTDASEPQPPLLDRFFGADLRLGPLLRCAHLGYSLIGFVGVGFGTLMIVANVATHPGLSAFTCLVTLIAAAFAFGHFFWEAASRDRISLWRWMLFCCCGAELASTWWTTVQNPPARVIGVSMLAVGALSVLLARLIVAHRTRLRACSAWVRVALAVPAWVLFAALGVVLLWP